MALNQIPNVIKSKIEEYNSWLDSVSIVTKAAITEDQIRETCTYLGQTATFYNTMYYGALLTTKWDQESPYNSLLPILSNGRRAYAGCAIIAAAQIIAYHKRHGMLGISANDWSYITSNPSAPANSRISELIKNVFDNVAVSYDESGTSANIGGVRDYLGRFFFVDMRNEKNLNYDFSSIGNTGLSFPSFLPTYMRGSNDNGTGHAWVVDGKKTERSDIYDEYVQYIEGRDEPIYHKFHITTFSHDYVSCNWGWGNSSAWLSNFVFGGTGYGNSLRMLQYVY